MVLITVLFCVLFSLPNFVLLFRYLPEVMDLEPAVAWISAGFALSAAVLLFLIRLWLRRSGRSICDLGWRKPTSRAAIGWGVVLALAWLGLGYSNHVRLFPEVSVTRVDFIRVASASLTVFGGSVEEIAMRGAVMTELSREKVATWLQILISGVCFAIYHSLHTVADGPLVFAVVFAFSTILGAALAGIYVLGRRSLTPCIVAHGLINLLGEPFLLMTAINASLR